jgi:AcrR family transcriptional regulator
VRHPNEVKRSWLLGRAHLNEAANYLCEKTGRSPMERIRDNQDTSFGPRTAMGAALREFGEKRFAGARVDKITRQAKANRKLLCHYFGNEEALFKGVLELAFRETALRRFVDQMFRPSSVL